MNNSSLKGAAYEQLAATHITENGLTVIHQNYRSKVGEIDLIATDQTTIVFIEVKYRAKAYFGNAIEQVTASKIVKLRRCAEHYLQRHQPNNYSCRFDVIGINGTTPSNSDILWIKDAF